jgi:hypothetical protein
MNVNTRCYEKVLFYIEFRDDHFFLNFDENIIFDEVGAVWKFLNLVFW